MLRKIRGLKSEDTGSKIPSKDTGFSLSHTDELIFAKA